MKAAKFVVGAIALVSGSAAMAEDLQFYASTTSGSLYFYDKDTIKRVGNFLTVWVFIDRSKDKTETARSERQKYRIDCSQEEVGLLAYYDYDPQGNVLKSDQYSYPIMVNPAPQSIGEALWRGVCSE